MAAFKFTSFFAYNELPGCKMTASKGKPLGREQKIQGVLVRFDEHSVVVAPTEERREKLARLARRALDGERPTPTQASVLVGKTQFYDSSCVGHVGKQPPSLLTNFNTALRAMSD